MILSCKHLIIYIDDVHLRWTLSSIVDGHSALGDLAHLSHVWIQH